MSHHKIEVKNLSYCYEDGTNAICDISFELSHGESLGIIGANGAGKSTLLMLLMGVIFPKEGEIIIGDIKLTKKTLNIIRQRMGLVFQNPDDQLFMNSVFEDVAFGPYNYKLDEDEVEKCVYEALKQVNILHLKDKPPYMLSAGEKRAASIATILALKPDILVMDEPTNALDPMQRRKVIEILKNFKHTKIITSHDLDMILETCDRVIILKDGKIIENGDCTEILSNKPLLNACNLELPLSLQNCPVCSKNLQNKY